VNIEKLSEMLEYKPTYFQWAGIARELTLGCDLFNAVNHNGQRKMIIVETNSCPSGQKSMPLVNEIADEMGGYSTVIEGAFKEIILKTDKQIGGLAVICDKNMMEASGYAATMADLTHEDVHLVEFHVYDKDPPVRWDDGLMSIRLPSKGITSRLTIEWIPIRACFRYTTQKPWNRFPVNSKTLVLNSVLYLN
jgi:hypothetical protein